MTTRHSQAASLEQPAPWLPADSPARVAQWIGWLVLAVVAAGGAFICLVPLPVTVQAPFTLVPEEGADPIQAPLAAEIAAVRVREGQEVKAGEELFTLRSPEILNWQTRLREALEDQRALTERVSKLEEAHAAELAIKEAEIVQAEREVTFRQKHCETTKDFLRRAGILAKDGLMAEVELMRHELEAAESEKDLVLSEKGKQQLNLQRQGLVTTRSRQRTEESAEAAKLTAQAATLREQLEHCVGGVKSLPALYDAVVLSVSQRNAGSVVAAGTELCQLARVRARVCASLAIPENALPVLRPGQRAHLRCTAYPYQRYGVLLARLEWVSPAAVNTPSGLCFLARATLEPSAPEARGRYRVGMRGEARVVVGRQTLLQSLTEPLRALRENVRVE